ncbi:serine hydrolase domain-containing protein [Streptomyces sp. 769]|uniref:serine hydrolase domain-containing protein n=1 Tax=Streptomyces sp. 769 TaxID=1262452 RepID=UPI0005800FD1|nr:serine hydrolase domain-containing protein [Streptomyces sp. 769]
MAGKSRARRLTAVLGAVTAAVLMLPSSASAQQADDHAAARAALSKFQAAGGPGAGILAGSGTDFWTYSAGTAVINTNTPIRPVDHYRIGSQTKSFTAAVVMQLVDEGKVSLDAPIEKYLPGVVDGNGYDGNTITVRQLLQHTSGIPTNTTTAPEANPDGTFTLAALVRDGLKHPPASAPGAEWHYSNTNYEILGLLIEKVTGSPVAQVITSRIIQPLNLTQTTFPAAGNRAVAEPAVHGYNGVRIGPFFFWTDVLTAFEPSIYSTAGAMISTEQDISTFYQALIGGRVVSPASLAEMKKARDIAPGLGYGLGLIKHPLPCGGVAWGHDGDVTGYYTQTMVTEDGRHAAVVTNALTPLSNPVQPLYELLDTALCEK